MKKLFLSLFFIVFFFNSSYAVRIDKLEVKNNNRITKETIATYGNIDLKKDYSQSDLNEVIKNLYNTNFFKDLSIKVENNTLIILVEENKIIQSVLIEGVKSNKIKDAIKKKSFF